jgi:hypothetical protein
VRIPPRAQVLEAIEAERRASGKRDPELANLRPALYLTGPLRIPFRGSMWSAHVSFDDGVRTVDIAQRIERGRGAEDWEAISSAVNDARLLAARLLRRFPERWWHKLGRVTGLRRNPVRDWTEQEVGEIIGFFLMCRTTSRVGGFMTSSPKTPTSSTSSRSSRESFRHGPAAMGSL